MRIILLEHPRVPSSQHFNDIANTPLWSCLMTGYAASSLRQAGYEPTILEATGLSFDETAKLLTEAPPDLLAVHAVYFWEETGRLFEMLMDVRRSGFNGTLCLYGFFPTLAWNDILTHVEAVDCIVVGEPERSLVELARTLQRGDAAPISGIAARAGGSPKLSALRDPIDPLDDLPFPLRPSLDGEETASVLASRGCYNGCSFCLIPTLDAGKAAWRGRSAANVAAEIEGLVERGKKDIYFVDPNFVGPGSRGAKNAEALAHALAEFDITFGMETRANDLTRPLLKSLTAAGLKSMLLGIESGSPHVLKRLRKNTSVTQNEDAIRAVRDAGVEPEIGFIMFEPGSTLEDVRENVRFLERNRLLDRLGRTANLLYHEHIAFKGTPGYHAARSLGLLVPQGLYGFAGRLRYADPRVGWLAGIMRPICQFVLGEMGRPASSIHWSAESVGAPAFQAVNDRLTAIFHRLLKTAERFDHAPENAWSQRVLDEARVEIQAAVRLIGRDGSDS